MVSDRTKEQAEMSRVSRVALLSAKTIGLWVLGCSFMAAAGLTSVLLRNHLPDLVMTIVGAIGTGLTAIVVLWLVIASVGDKLGAARRRNQATEDIIMATCPRCEDRYPAGQKTCPALPGVNYISPSGISNCR